MAAVVQHITYNEFLPMVLGKDVMDRYGLLLHKEVYSPIRLFLYSRGIQLMLERKLYFCCHQ